MSGTCTGINESLEKFAVQNQKAADAEWQAEILKSSDWLSKFTSDHKDMLGEAEEMVDVYINRELKHDIPTGNYSLHTQY